MMARVTRRGLLGKGAAGAAVVAAAAALPASVQATPSRGLSTYRDPAIMARLRELQRAFKATLTPAQQNLWGVISDLETDQLVAEQERFVAALGQHIPGLAKAIEIVAFGHGDISSGRCCEIRYV